MYLGYRIRMGPAALAAAIHTHYDGQRGERQARVSKKARVEHDCDV